MVVVLTVSTVVRCNGEVLARMLRCISLCAGYRGMLHCLQPAALTSTVLYCTTLHCWTAGRMKVNHVEISCAWCRATAWAVPSEILLALYTGFTG